jgi:hypothetical protein
LPSVAGTGIGSAITEPRTGVTTAAWVAGDGNGDVTVVPAGDSVAGEQEASANAATEPRTA